MYVLYIFCTLYRNTCYIREIRDRKNFLKHKLTGTRIKNSVEIIIIFF